MRSATVTPTAIEWLVPTWRLITSGSRYPKKNIRSFGELPVGTKGLRPDEVYVRSLQPLPPAAMSNTPDRQHVVCTTGIVL